MTNQELLDILGGVKGEYIFRAQKLRAGEKRTSSRIASWKRTALIAAVISLLLMLVGCTIAYVLHLQDVKIGQETITRDEWYGPNGEYASSESWENSYLSIQGFNNSANQRALLEWTEFQESYDTDYVLLKQNDHNESSVQENYYLTYNAYTPEMADKLDEILDKNGLKALSQFFVFQRWEAPLFYRALQLDSLFIGEANPDWMSGYFFSDGSFSIESSMESAGHDIRIGLDYYHSEYFMPYPFLVKNIEDWTQWNYTARSGQALLLGQFENAGLIICKNDDSVLVCSVELWEDWGDNAVTLLPKEILEQVADQINYSINPQPVDLRSAEQMRGDYPEPTQRKSFLSGFMLDSSGTWHPPAGYSDSLEQYVGYIMANDPNAGDRYFAFRDLDNDGEAELLLGTKDGILTEVADVEDGMVNICWATWITKENVIVKHYPATSNPENYAVFTLDCTVHFELEKIDDGWNETIYDENGDWTTKPITNSDASAILNRYSSIPLKTKPLSDFSLENN